MHWGDPVSSQQLHQKVSHQHQKEVQKSHQAGFLSYCRSASSSSKDSDVSKQALGIIESYRGMSQDEKKNWWWAFLKSGGKKSGLGVIHKQMIQMTDLATEKGWASYCTPIQSMKFSEVCPRMPTPHMHTNNQLKTSPNPPRKIIRILHQKVGGTGGSLWVSICRYTQHLLRHGWGNELGGDESGCLS